PRRTARGPADAQDGHQVQPLSPAIVRREKGLHRRPQPARLDERAVPVVRNRRPRRLARPRRRRRSQPVRSPVLRRRGMSFATMHSKQAPRNRLAKVLPEEWRKFLVSRGVPKRKYTAVLK